MHEHTCATHSYTPVKRGTSVVLKNVIVHAFHFIDDKPHFRSIRTMSHRMELRHDL